MDLSLLLIQDAFQSFLREAISFPDHVEGCISKIALAFFEVFGWEHYLVAVSLEDLLSLVLQVKEFDLVDVMG